MSGPNARIAWSTYLITAASAASLLTTTPAAAAAGSEVKNGDYAFTAKLNIGDSERACTGALVDAQWVITAASCFANTPGQAVQAGKPALKTTVTVGRADLTQTSGEVVEAVSLVPRADRDVVMVKLAQPVTGIAPVRLAATAPARGEALRTNGFGRTQTEWVPDRLHSADIGVQAVDSTSLTVDSRAAGVPAVCKGDTGGPVLREQGGNVELIGLNSRSWQGGCLGADANETRTGAVSSRVDDIGPWIQQVRSLPKRFLTATGDFNGDGRADLAVLADQGKSQDGRNQAALWVYTADGKGGFSEPRTVWESGSDSWSWESSKLAAGDFNGDGKTDLAVLYGYGKNADGRNETALFTFASKGNDGFEAPRKVWESGKGSWSSWNWDASKLVAGDFNGDGKADLAVLYGYGKTSDNRNETGLFTLTSTGNGFNEPQKVWDSTKWDNGKGSWDWSASKIVAGDFNGDGKTDLAVLYGSGKTSDGRNETALWFTANGDGFNDPQKVWDSTKWDNGKGSWDWSASKIVAGDFNGDGKTDLAVLYRYDKTSDGRNRTGLWVFDGSKNGFDAPHMVWDSAKWGNGKESWNWDSSELTAGDFNGDGKTDISITYNYGQGPDGRNQTALWTFTSKGATFDDPGKVWDNNL
ncbi:FG-GAP-like repeat-containing protein [Streptoverticillium reticulum]|uniref:FG-GAP-like repeat-containing protein n=1 Tax=Streptoverticillium reticulum TaxID=1433415 RepID=UPI0039BF3F08